MHLDAPPRFWRHAAVCASHPTHGLYKSNSDIGIGHLNNQIEVYHGTWIPRSEKEFDNSGEFVFWIEAPASGKETPKSGQHPDHIDDPERLQEFLASELKFGAAAVTAADAVPSRFWATMPSADGRPLPSLEMALLSGSYPPDDFEWNDWEINGLTIRNPLAFLRDLEFLSGFGGTDLQIGHDLKFWMQFARQLRANVRQHQFLPVLKCIQPKRGKSQPKYVAGWAPAGSQYERSLRDYSVAMPAVCTLVRNASNGRVNGEAPVSVLDRTDLLRQFSEQQVDGLVASTPYTKSFLKPFRNTWLGGALVQTPARRTAADIEPPCPAEEDVTQWHAWQRKIIGQAQGSGFTLGFRLGQSDRHDDDRWHLAFFVSCNTDPSLSLDLSDWWDLPKRKRGDWHSRFGNQFERNLLVSLGQAARMCPLLWQGMETAKPTGVDIDLNTAYEFLKEDSLVLESAGYRVVLPSWWTPKGRRRARLRIRPYGTSGQSQQSGSNSGLFQIDSLIRYDYRLSIDGEPVSEDEWLALMEAKSPLVKYRGEWMEIDQRQLSETLELFRSQSESDGVEFRQMIKDMAIADPKSEEFVLDEVLGDVLKGLRNLESLEPMDNPVGMRGELRVYQKKGLAWLARQERLGLNPCLADDMGLGKTVQLIALLLHERDKEDTTSDSTIPPTLLVAPTSVLSNWKKEAGKFAPNLRCHIHHGSGRPRDPAEFAESISGHDLVVTSFNLVRSDLETFKSMKWQRVVVDEAQNIKNPKSAQAKAIFALPSTYRIAMTGTPIENRLMDMWSLFRFLNPGYLGTEAQFRRAYEKPIQRENDLARTQQLQKLVQPFILRRLKSDKSIINDLPDKVEQKVYCNLTKEQASLYQAVVRDVEEKLEDSDGMGRRGLILSTLMRLKQVCNHPSQFLQDESPFHESRSHKLTRLNEMIEEALTESDSMLVFTQFTEIGDRLEAQFRERHSCPVHYLHGGTTRQRREKMIESFQDPESPSGIFVLSLRAGGVGITLTRANHVFHFDRWWNPAVENQATDRAYRIGQQKTVFAHKMVTLGTLEERIDEMIETKKALAENIVGADENWLTEMDNDSFRKLIALNRQSIMEA